MHYLIQHHLRDIRVGRDRYFVTEFFRALIDGLQARYPHHSFGVRSDERHADLGYGGPHSCMHLSVWHPDTRRYILVSFFDNWRHHFDRSLGWEPDRMTQFFYGGGFDFGEYYRFRRLMDVNPNLAFPADIQSVYRELPYVPYFDGFDADMQQLYVWPKRPQPRMIFRGWLWEPRALMMEGLQRDDIVVVDTNAGGEKLGYLDYLTEMTEYAAVLSLPGGAPMCHRDIEAFAVGVPVIRPHVPSHHPDPLLPGVHYISCHYAPDWGDDGYPRYASYADFQRELLRVWDHVKDDREFLAFVATNARAWYARHCTLGRQVERLLDEMDLSTLEDTTVQPAVDAPVVTYAPLLKIQPQHEDVCGVTGWLWVKADMSSWPGPRLEWIHNHETLYFRYLRDTHTVVTAGANCGLHARMFARRFERVYAFEPDPLNFHCLVNNCQADHVVKMMCALGDVNGMVGLHRASLDQCGSHRIHAGAPPAAASVPMIALDTLGLARCDLIQLDVEGFEDRVLIGARDTIQRCRPVIVVETLQGEDFPGVVRLLTDWGYRRVGISGSDSLWVPGEQPRENLVEAGPLCQQA